MTNSTGHIEVSESYNEATGEMTLTGSFGTNPKLPRAIYVVGVALRDYDGEIGNVWRWALIAPGECESIQDGDQICDRDNENNVFICRAGAWEWHPCQDACNEEAPGTIAVGCDYSDDLGEDACFCQVP